MLFLGNVGEAEDPGIFFASIPQIQLSAPSTSQGWINVKNGFTSHEVSVALSVQFVN